MDKYMVDYDEERLAQALADMVKLYCGVNKDGVCVAPDTAGWQTVQNAFLLLVQHGQATWVGPHRKGNPYCSIRMKDKNAPR